MPGRRVIVHAGFHKTATTSAQKFLRANGKNIWPCCSLVLPGKLRKGAALMAVRYSRYGKPALLDAFGEDLHGTLSKIDQNSSRKVLISDESIAGRMPGRDGQLSYNATPADLAGVTKAVADAVTGTVYTVDLADLTGPNGPAQPLIDLIELPDQRRRKLVPHPVENAGPDDGLMDDLLALNRSNLSDKDLNAAKADLLGKAQNDDG